ncbi:MAG: endonuclease [Thioalkalivibrio sp.]|nr:MAG: endonuclease [Thioalkalivibrio sp.]
MTPIRVATYNIHAGIGRDGHFNAQRIAQVINELRAEVVALHEVESQSGDLGALGVLAAETGLRALAGPTMLRGEATYGNALLTCCDLSGVERIDLSVPGREPRGALDVRVQCRGGPLRVVATHLGLARAERGRQVRQLMDRLDPGDPVPIVLMGDMNEWILWSKPLRQLHKRFGRTSAPATFPARFPLFALDRLWIRPPGRLVRLYRHESPLARIASDHLPLVAEIDLSHH